jgi:deoxyribonuclease V
MILAIDVDYKESTATVAGVFFKHWQDCAASDVVVTQVEGICEYEPGSFYKRELPCILKLLDEVKHPLSCIVVDGYVFLDGISKSGLGKYLYDALVKKIPVIGVAKRSFSNISDDFALLRGDSKKPLYITAVGIKQSEAMLHIASMYGKHRHPYLLKKADQVCRGITET